MPDCGTLTVRISSAYGRELIYPACPRAEMLARIAGTLTLSRPVLAEARRLGFAISIETPTLGD